MLDQPRCGLGSGGRRSGRGRTGGRRGDRRRCRGGRVRIARRRMRIRVVRVGARAEHRREHVRQPAFAGRVRIDGRARCDARARHDARHGGGRHGFRHARRGDARTRGRRRHRGEIRIGECNDFDAAVIERAVRQHDRVGAERLAHETKCVAARCAGEFANVQAEPPMTLTTLIVRVSGTSAYDSTFNCGRLRRRKRASIARSACCTSSTGGSPRFC